MDNCARQCTAELIEDWSTAGLVYLDFGYTLFAIGT
jgi:hypothetical protein